jgi:hypothetical protein
MGPIRPAPLLVRKQQKIRRLSAAEETVRKLLSAKLKTIEGHSSRLNEDDDNSDILSSGGEDSGSEVLSEDEVNQLECIMSKYLVRNRSLEQKIVKLQRRARGFSIRKLYLAQRRAIITIQRCYRRFQSRQHQGRLRKIAQNLVKLQSLNRVRKLLRRFVSQRTRCAVVLQAFWRRIRQRSRYISARRMIILIESVWRMRAGRLQCKRMFASAKKLCQRWKGYLARKKLLIKIGEYYDSRLSLLLLLWEINKVSLIYRTQFWAGVRKYRQDGLGSSLLISLGILREEVTRLFTAIGVTSLKSLEPFQFYLSTGGTIPPEVLRIYELPNRPALLSSLPKTAIDAITLAGIQEEGERKELYLNMKKKCSPADLQQLYVLLPGIIGSKKRKQTLSKVAWTFGTDLQKADTSAKVCATAFPSTLPAAGNGPAQHFVFPAVTPMMSTKRREIIQGACAAATVTLLAASRHHEHKNNNGRSRQGGQATNPQQKPRSSAANRI